MNKEEVKRQLRIDIVKLAQGNKTENSAPIDGMYVEANEELYRIVGLVR